MKWRRYRAPEGYTVTTYELPTEVVRRLCLTRVQQELERFERKQARLARQARALALIAEGWKHAAVALEVGLSESQVYRIALAGRPGAKTYNRKQPTPKATS